MSVLTINLNAMNKPRILIEVIGGIVQHIASTTNDIEIILIDHDNLQEGEKFDNTPLSPDQIMNITEMNQYIEKETEKYSK